MDQDNKNSAKESLIGNWVAKDGTSRNLILRVIYEFTSTNTGSRISYVLYEPHGVNGDIEPNVMPITFLTKYYERVENYQLQQPLKASLRLRHPGIIEV